MLVFLRCFCGGVGVVVFGWCFCGGVFFSVAFGSSHWLKPSWFKPAVVES